jgi:hypothetical protein
MSTNTNFEEAIEQNTVELDNGKTIQLCAVSMLHPTMQEACGDFEDIGGAELYGILRSLDVSRVLLSETEPICVALEFSDEEPPLYYLIRWHEWSEVLNYYCKNVVEEIQLDWRKYGF